jgi:DNA-directed RNA polymerase subunit RPC12/RpoP
MGEKREDRRRAKRGTPDALSYDFLFLVTRLWMGRRHRLEVDDALLARAEAPYILLVNHESFYDYYYVSRLAHPRRPTYLVNEYYCTRPILKTLAGNAGILSKKLFTRDMSTAVGILRMLRRGYPVVIFPEGRLSPDGRSNPIVEGGAGFYKRLKVDLVLARIEGAYFADPKWRKKKLRSTVRIRVERVLKREELQSIPDGELDGIIAAALYTDASAAPFNRYPQRDKAKGLEGLLYRCADCGALYTTRGVGNELICTACGARHPLDERYRFADGMESIPAYYDRIRALEEPELDRLSLRCPVRTRIFGEAGGPVRRERGECFLCAEGFRYRSDSMDFSIPMERLPALAFSCGAEFELYHDRELCYFYPIEHPQQCARWALLVDMAAARRAAPPKRQGGTHHA